MQREPPFFHVRWRAPLRWRSGELPGYQRPPYRGLEPLTGVRRGRGYGSGNGMGETGRSPRSVRGNWVFQKFLRGLPYSMGSGSYEPGVRSDRAKDPGNTHTPRPKRNKGRTTTTHPIPLFRVGNQRHPHAQGGHTHRVDTRARRPRLVSPQGGHHDQPPLEPPTGLRPGASAPMPAVLCRARPGAVRSPPLL